MTTHLKLFLFAALIACGDKGDDTGPAEEADSDTDSDSDSDSDSDTDTDTDSDTDTDTDTDTNCASDPGADTICVDLLGETIEIGQGIAWDGQGSYEGSAVLLWGGGASHNEPPTVTIQVGEEDAADGSLACDVSPNAIVYTDASDNQWWAIDDFEYYGSSCSITLDAYSLALGDEISGSFTAEAVNEDYTTDTMSGTFRVTVQEW